MSCYVDPLKRWPRPKGARASYTGNGELWSHLSADTVAELKEFAAKLGLRPEWFQEHRRPWLCHYDVTPGMRTRAVALGAIELTHLQFRRRLAALVMGQKWSVEDPT